MSLIRRKTPAQANREESKKQLQTVNKKLDRLDRRVSTLEKTVQVYRREV